MTYTNDLDGRYFPTFSPSYTFPIYYRGVPAVGADQNLYKALVDHHVDATGSYPSGEIRAGLWRRVVESRRRR